MTARVVIAARGGPDAKSRFGERLTAEQRDELVAAMLTDMLDALSQCASVAGVHLTTPTPELAELAAARGAEAILETPRGLNHAFASARERVATAHADAVIVLLPGDLPRLDCWEMDQIVEAARDAIVLVPASADGGTGAIAAPAATALPLAFGAGSFQKHLAAAKASGLATRVIAAPSLGFDMDRPEDMDALLESGGGGAAAALLRRFVSAGEAAV